MGYEWNIHWDIMGCCSFNGVEWYAGIGLGVIKNLPDKIESNQLRGIMTWCFFWGDDLFSALVPFKNLKDQWLRSYNQYGSVWKQGASTSFSVPFSNVQDTFIFYLVYPILRHIYTYIIIPFSDTHTHIYIYKLYIYIHIISDSDMCVFVRVVLEIVKLLSSFEN